MKVERCRRMSLTLDWALSELPNGVDVAECPNSSSSRVLGSSCPRLRASQFRATRLRATFEFASRGHSRLGDNRLGK